LVSQQGQLQTTNSSTDLALSGNGFFVVNTSPTSPGSANSLYYTRAGNFTPDANGDLRNASGYYLMGWQLDSTGNIPSNRNDLSPININALSGKANPTTSITYAANLQSSTPVTSGYVAGDMANGTVTPDFQRTINVYDGQGGSQPLQLSFVKTGANQWNYEVSYQGNTANIAPATNPIYSGTMTFNTDGTLANADTAISPATGSISLNLPWNSTSGLSAQTVKLNLGTVGSSDGMTQFDSTSTQVSSNVDGALFGSLTGVSVDNNGFVTAKFSNGLTQNIYKLPVATFANPDGLAAANGNAYTTSNDSGTPSISEANTGGAGAIKSNSLESSTVDLASEFTNLITTQRAYSAASKIITTSSTMLDQLLAVVR
ncbi:MAG: flagellar hook protein FlgE, partial [Alphaproteobacteria bacterium]|nr:flagellar hook protein FlgE [Alphaproteobacteria bacterium]